MKRLTIIFITGIFALTIFAALPSKGAVQPSERGTVVTKTVESAHNYANNYDYTWTISQSGASKMRVYFYRYQVESNYDYIYVMDKNGNVKQTLTSSTSKYYVWSVWVDGDAAKIRLKTDYSVTYYGFKITKYEYEAGSVADTTAPTTSITSPASGSTVSGTTTISASASDNVGVSKVAFYIDSTLKGTDTTSPYSYSWDTTAYTNAAHTLYTKAYDAAGNVGTSASRSVTVSNSAPADDGGLLTAGATANGNMDSADGADMWWIDVPSNTASMRVVLECGSADFDTYGKFNAQPTTSSYDWRGYTSGGEDNTVTNPSTGRHYIMVDYYSGSGAYTLLVTLTAGSTADTTAPTTSITSPASGATVSGTTTISASASDNVGVTKVEFYIDSTLKSTDTSSPYSYSWDTTAYSNAAHTLYTKAYDAANNIGTSASRSVTVSNSVPTDDGGLLTAGTTANGNMDSADGADMWWIDVPTGTSSMRVVLECGSADFDTFGKFNAQPTTSSYDWRGYTSGGEDNTITNPSVGRHYIMVDYYSGSGAYTLLVTLTSGGGTTGDWGTGGKYAIIVGISNYASINDLSYCDEDALDWYNFLTGKGYECHVFYDGSYTSNSFTSIPSTAKKGYATEANVRAAIQGLAAHAVSGNSVCFVTSGHGSGTGTGSSYLCMYDCSGSVGCYYDTELAADIGLFANGVKTFIFVDHCYSGGLGPEIMALSTKANIYMTTTCTQDGYGYDDPTHQNGAWTYYFLENYLVSHSTASMETCFTSASSVYPYSGGDAPMQFDGSTSTSFYL